MVRSLCLERRTAYCYTTVAYQDGLGFPSYIKVVLHGIEEDSSLALATRLKGAPVRWLTKRPTNNYLLRKDYTNCFRFKCNEFLGCTVSVAHALYNRQRLSLLFRSRVSEGVCPGLLWHNTAAIFVDPVAWFPAYKMSFVLSYFDVFSRYMSPQWLQYLCWCSGFMSILWVSLDPFSIRHGLFSSWCWLGSRVRSGRKSSSWSAKGMSSIVCANLSSSLMKPYQFCLCYEA